MAEVKQGDVDSDSTRSGELRDLIDRWVEVTDRWVEHLDAGMGGTAPNGADPAQDCPPPDPSPGPAPGTTPGLGTG